MDCSPLDTRNCQLADVPHAGEQIPAGRPVLTAFGAGGSESEAMDDLERRVGEVERRLYDGE
jgi:predicted ATP-grasp superfamily ATP-dependent carboligase